MLASIGSIIKKEAIVMNKMAVDPIYKIYFKKASSTFEKAADDFRLAVGSIERIGNGLPGPKPNYLTLEEGKMREYREHLLQCFGALWDYLSGEDREVLRQFEGNVDNLTKEELLRLGYERAIKLSEM